MSRAPRLYSHQIIKMRLVRRRLYPKILREGSATNLSLSHAFSPLATCVTEAKNGHDGLTSSFGSSVSWSACELRSTKLFAIPILIRLGIWCYFSCAAICTRKTS